MYTKFHSTVCDVYPYVPVGVGPSLPVYAIFPGCWPCELCDLRVTAVDSKGPTARHTTYH